MKRRRQSVSDLLALRDSEPLDGARAVEASGDPRVRDPQVTERLNRLRALKADLQSLPALEPDPQVLERIGAQLAARQRRRTATARRMWTSGKTALASAAVVTLGVLLSFLVLDERAPRAPAGQIGGYLDERSEPDFTEPDRSGLTAELTALRQVSFQLEGLARAVPGGPTSGIRTGDPAESALLYRLADLDGQLLQSADTGYLDADTERTLWARRVELLGTLTRVRQINATRQVAYY